ncbi:arrestin domain-containing protein 3-like isoform X1 [Lepisosteus oculatus]|uniref:arrestin domain-containing protein 3-like isoform X1 n=1 Tax=Lepisosteus oculatus TaxID=7918 RepID=UPI00371FFC11
MAQGKVTSLTISCDYLNESNTFSSGDFISGRVIIDVTGNVNVQLLTISAKGRADVWWSERNGENDDTYSANEKYFKIKNVLIQSSSGRNVVLSGTQVYPFTFQIPHEELPSSVKGRHGSVRYWLEAKLHRPWRLSKTVKMDLAVVKHIDVNSLELLAPQLLTADKTLCCWFCSSGPVSLSARIERKGYTPGDSVSIFAEIENHSSREVKPKAALQQIQTFYATMKTQTVTTEIACVKGKPISAGGRETWCGRLLDIPLDTTMSVLNCKIMKVEYSVLVIVDIPCATALKVVFPVIIGTIPLQCPVN